MGVVFQAVCIENAYGLFDMSRGSRRALSLSSGISTRAVVSVEDLQLEGCTRVLYMMTLAEFHFCEFHVIAICNPGTFFCLLSSFVINIRKFQIGVVVSWVEYLLEYIYDLSRYENFFHYSVYLD